MAEVKTTRDDDTLLKATLHYFTYHCTLPKIFHTLHGHQSTKQKPNMLAAGGTALGFLRFVYSMFRY